MKGLLRRLARQAVGLEPIKVHAIARLPFVAPPAMTADQGTGRLHSQTRAPGATGPIDVSAAQDGRAEPSDRPRDTPETPGRRPTQARGSLPDVQTPARAAGELTGPTESRQGAVFPDKPLAPAPLLGERPQTNPAHGETDNTVLRILTPREAVPEPIAATPPLATPHPVVTPPGTASGERPANDAAVAQHGRRQRPPRAAPSPSRSDEAPEVHVHIGRIEVTAVQEASAGRRKPAAGVQPLSLNEYLKRRRRRRS